jgi:hypothetical protein
MFGRGVWVEGRESGNRAVLPRPSSVVRHGSGWLAGCCWLRAGGEHCIVPVSRKDFEGHGSGLTLISKKPKGKSIKSQLLCPKASQRG